MKRARFILIAGLGLGAVAIPSIYFRYRTPDDDTFIAEPELLSYIWDDETIAGIGKSYRAENPDENDEKKLRYLIAPDGSVEGKSLYKHLRTRILQDFESNDLTVIDGWMLSRTEARQCALFSLMHSK